MEPWQYSSLQIKYSSLLQLLSSSSQHPRTKPSSNDLSVNDQTMSMNSFGGETIKTGIKRKLSDSDDQAILPKKTNSTHYHGGHTKLALDVYTQTNASYLAEQNNTLPVLYSHTSLKSSSKSKRCLVLWARITQLVLENTRRYERIENILTNIDRKINLFGSESSHIYRHAMKPPLTVEVKPAASFEPVTPSTPASYISDIESNETLHFCQNENNIKSPVATCSPSINNVDHFQGIPTSTQSHSGNEWSQNATQGIQAVDEPSIKPTNHDSRSELRGKAPDMSDSCIALVPVIFASEEKAKRCTTNEIVLQDLLNGNITNPEDSTQIFRGCWLGDRQDPHSRVWYHGDSKVIQRAEASGSNPAKLSLNLLEALFTREEMAASNVNGARGRDLLDPIKIKAIYAHINFKFPTDPDKQELRWHFLKPRIDSKCRAQRRIQRDHQAVGDTRHSNEKPFRKKLGKSSLDPKIKEELLYGLIKSDTGVPSQVVGQAVNDICNGSGENNSGNVSGNPVQSSANSTVLVYENNA